MFVAFLFGCLVGLAAGLLVAARDYRALIKSQNAVIDTQDKLLASQKELADANDACLAADAKHIAVLQSVIENQRRRLDIYEQGS